VYTGSYGDPEWRASALDAPRVAPYPLTERALNPGTSWACLCDLGLLSGLTASEGGVMVQPVTYTQHRGRGSNPLSHTLLYR